MVDVSNTHAAHQVLIVDDNADFREALADLLQTERFEVMTASSAADALRHLRQGFRPCVVILDLRMPGMDGWTLYDQMARDPGIATIPVIIISGYAHHAARARERGVSQFLAKPADPDAMIAAVEKHCHRRGVA